ncbi:MAG: uracil-DNA glycosylase family protein [Prevotella sp.]|nr:uracil-DNA glycosylase family protein [Prevotella sp.]
MKEIEQHPLQPFLPSHARLLMLGSFPPSRKRWCMDFFYPNFNNDMWRIWGIVCFQDKDYFVDLTNKRFKQQEIETFLNEKGIALYDTACAVVRTKNTASDKDLDVVEETDIDGLLQQIPNCGAIVTTGQKATDILTARFGIRQPAVGEYVSFDYQGRIMRLYRMPSSSRAYPLALEKKAEKYKTVLEEFKVQSSEFRVQSSELRVET